MRPHRSCLSVPGSNPRMLAKAATLPADQVILDLEDSVAPADKAAARKTIVEALQQNDYGTRVVTLRVNAVDTSWCEGDVTEVVEAAGARLDSVIIPKVEQAADVALVERLLIEGVRIEAQIESARGLLAVREIAASSPRLQALILGPGDLSASLGLGHLSIGHEEPAALWQYVRVTMLVACRAHGLLAIDGPYANFNDPSGLEASTRAATALGYDGKWVIHPSQIDTVNRLFTPDADAFKRALGILEAYQGGAARYEGEMIDEATRKMAEAVARRGRWLGLS